MYSRLNGAASSFGSSGQPRPVLRSGAPEAQERGHEAEKVHNDDGISILVRPS